MARETSCVLVTRKDPSQDGHDFPQPSPEVVARTTAPTTIVRIVQASVNHAYSRSAIDDPSATGA
jgi:hypothetical protein